MRFSIIDDAPTKVSIVYVIEKDHAPAMFGTLEYSISDARLDGPQISPVVAQQARAFLESYLRRRASRKAAP